MRLLSDIVAEGTEEVVLARDFGGWVVSFRAGEKVLTLVNVQCVLERTAVVYEAGHVDDKRVIRLDRIEVHESQVKWVPRNPVELRIMRSRRVGQMLGAGFRETKAS